MNEERAKFILSACRPGDQDREDPEFREALEFSRKNPKVGKWLEEQMAFDESVAEAVRDIPVPNDLRDNILAGARVSAAPRPAWKDRLASPAVRALAAVFVIGLFAAVAIVSRWESPDSGLDAALSAITDLSENRTNLDLASTDPAAIRAWLEEMEPNLSRSYPVSMDEIGAMGCKRVHSGAGLVTIVCFKHDGKMFHLASYHVPERNMEASGPEPLVEQIGKWLSATWARGEYTHTLITADKSVGSDTLLKVIEGFRA